MENIVPYVAEDIEIFIMTHSRAMFLSQTLRSIFAQTEKRFQTTVIDNGSTDNTLDVLRQFQSDYNLKVQVNGSYLAPGKSFKKAQELAQGKWTIVFHDDDLMHPEYIAHILESVNQRKNLALLVSGMMIESDPQARWVKLSKKPRYFTNVADFAATLYGGFWCNFASAVYKTEYFKDISLRLDIYGKICDRPFLFDITEKGEVALFTEPYVKYRVHKGQDSVDRATGPYPAELMALQKKYLALLGDDLLTSRGRVFVLNNYRCLRQNAHSLGRLSMVAYCKEALSAGATTKKALFFGRCLYPAVFVFFIMKRIISKLKIIIMHYKENVRKNDRGYTERICKRSGVRTDANRTKFIQKSR